MLIHAMIPEQLLNYGKELAEKFCSGIILCVILDALSGNRRSWTCGPI